MRRSPLDSLHKEGGVVLPTSPGAPKGTFQKSGASDMLDEHGAAIPFERGAGSQSSILLLTDTAQRPSERLATGFILGFLFLRVTPKPSCDSQIVKQWLQCSWVATCIRFPVACMLSCHLL